MTFKEQLYITLIDKILIGGMIAVVGFAASMVLENYKSEQTVEAEFAKERVRKIGEVQIAVNRLELIARKGKHAKLEEIEAFIRKVRPVEIKKDPATNTYYKSYKILPPEENKNSKLEAEASTSGNKVSLKEIEKELSAMKENTEIVIEQNRFWLGEPLYEQYTLYYKHVSELYEKIVITPTSQAEIEQINQNIEKSRMDIQKVLKTIQ